MEQFPKGKRLLTRLDYSRVFSKSKRIQNKAFTLLIHHPKNSNQQPAHAGKMGLVVSKKVHKTAVQRNRIKRLIRESFRRHPNVRSAEYVVLAKPLAASMNNADLLTLLHALWSQTENQE
ncbi:ribonuclease P protein component [Marinicella meishanensis]|uniref:ribonuclease P protein component n=1 Tax=Marinicella meishanensis TaxID=2873263 RepID=UPI001CBA891A|nr:ribonuclease P protein component [Marinicella sp. NBU2979]